MWPALGSLQLLSPWFLGVALLSPLLIYAYRKKSPRLRTIVSSLVVLKLLSPREAPKTRFKPPLRFFLELLALLLLVAAATRPVSLDDEHRIAVVLDNSLSMRAFDSTSSLPGTRLERAKTAVRNWLNEHGEFNQIDVYSSSPKLARVGAESLPASSAVSVLDGIQASTAGDTLEASLAELLETAKFERILVVSDRLAEYIDDQKVTQNLFRERETAKLSTHLSGITVGESVANIFVSGFSLLADSIGDGRQRLMANVGYVGAGNPEIEVSFSEIAEREQVLERRRVRANADNISEVTVEIPAHNQNVTAYKLEVRALAAGFGGKEDAITEDNSAWVLPRSTGGEKVLLVAAEEMLTRSGLNSISAFSIDTVTPGAFGTKSLDPYKLIIFHRSAPSIIPQKPTLYILPPEENPLFPARFVQSSLQVSSWMQEHPITSYLKVPLLRLSNAEVFSVPAWAQGVLNVEQGAVLVAGESRGIRLAAIGTELLPFEGMKTPVMSVLTLNLFNWLTGGAELTGSSLTGSIVPLESSATVKVRDPSGKESNAKGSIRLENPGLYLVRANGSEPRTLAANAFFPSETNTFTKSVYATPSRVEHERPIAEGATSWWTTLLCVVIGILLLEQLLYFLPLRKQAA